ncbi:hypothetical protein [Streptomyces goshikiensis]|uniref:hypothetical protein n=1 Tax=Streptomyces goshikiensis TaxID=1942 RepID=UPI00332BD573
MDHPLAEGDKRTAWLAVNAVDPGGVDQAAAYEPVIDVASGAEGDVARIAARLRWM